MLDINYIRENIDKVKKSIEDRKAEVNLDQLILQDDQRRKLIIKVDELRAKRNQHAKNRDQSEGGGLKSELKTLEKDLSEVEKKWKELMLQVPNILLDEVPIGDISQNKILKKTGKIPEFLFKVKDHIELGKLLNIIDFDRGVKVGGFRGYFLKNQGARLHWAVLQFAFDYLLEKGFSPVVPPVINKRFALLGGGQFPWGEDDTYQVGDEDFLVGTAEIPMMAMHSDETIEIKELPKKYVGMSACFRTEVGSYGKDTKGLYRVHEFYKVEQIILCEADQSQSEKLFKELQENSEGILNALGLPYQVVALSSQDMGKKAVLTYDIETWMPARGGYGETHSNSAVYDFQCRRLKIKYKNNEETKYCYSLNNTAIASPRILIAILENFQQADGSVKIPQILQKYTGFSEIIP